MKLPLSTLLLSLALTGISQADTGGWPAWRGDLLGSGRTTANDLPTEWGKEKNIRWRIDLPEAGNSTPVVHGDRVFVTQPVTETKWRGLMCFSREDGSLLWKNGVTHEKDEPTHRSNPYCSASPATDGELVIAYYGSAGIAAYDFAGKQLWHRDLGAISHTWGNSTSPLIHGDLVIQYHGPAKNAVLHALDKRTGATVWEWAEPVWKPGKRTDGFGDREGEGVIGSFSTPILVDTGEREELIMSFPMEMKAFDPKTGEVLWTCGGLNPLVYTSPVYSETEKIVVAMGGYYGNSIGVKVGGNGDVTDSHRLWHLVRHNGGIGTGVVVGHHYYYQDSGGVAYCDDMKTGETLWKARLPGAGKSWGSFVLTADRHIYTLSQAGDTVVFKANPEKMEVIAQSDLGEETNSSLAIAGGELFVRTHESLWCVGRP